MQVTSNRKITGDSAFVIKTPKGKITYTIQYDREGPPPSCTQSSQVNHSGIMDLTSVISMTTTSHGCVGAVIAIVKNEP